MERSPTNRFRRNNNKGDREDGGFRNNAEKTTTIEKKGTKKKKKITLMITGNGIFPQYDKKEKRRVPKGSTKRPYYGFQTCEDLENVYGTTYIAKQLRETSKYIEITVNIMTPPGVFDYPESPTGGYYPNSLFMLHGAIMEADTRDVPDSEQTLVYLNDVNTWLDQCLGVVNNTNTYSTTREHKDGGGHKNGEITTESSSNTTKDKDKKKTTAGTANNTRSTLLLEGEEELYDGIEIEEILVVGLRCSNINGSALPILLRRIGHDFPNVKITVVDITNKSAKNQKEYLYGNTEIVNWNNVTHITQDSRIYLQQRLEKELEAATTMGQCGSGHQKSRIIKKIGTPEATDVTVESVNRCFTSERNGQQYITSCPRSDTIAVGLWSYVATDNGYHIPTENLVHGTTKTTRRTGGGRFVGTTSSTNINGKGGGGKDKAKLRLPPSGIVATAASSSSSSSTKSPSKATTKMKKATADPNNVDIDDATTAVKASKMVSDTYISTGR